LAGDRKECFTFFGFYDDDGQFPCFSGSLEMNEASNISSRAISLEQELRGSSLSSDEGTDGMGMKGRSHSVETGPMRPTSPRMDR